MLGKYEKQARKKVPVKRAWPLPSSKRWLFYKDNDSITQFIPCVKFYRFLARRYHENKERREKMEGLVRAALHQYNAYISETEFFEKWLAYKKNDDMRDALVIDQMKITTIQSWLKLLNADEAFVIQKHLIDELEWPRVEFAFQEQWKGMFTRSGRTLVKYQATALKKIVYFCENHRDLILSLFGNLEPLPPEDDND